MMTRRRVARHIGRFDRWVMTTVGAAPRRLDRGPGGHGRLPSVMIGTRRRYSDAGMARTRGRSPRQPDQAAVCLELFCADVRLVERREPEELRRRPRWRVEVS